MDMDSFSTNDIGGDSTINGIGVDSSGDSSSNNALILSLYLIDSKNDLLLHSNGQCKQNDTNSIDNIKKRARLYQRLSQACKIANDILLNSGTTSSTLTQDVHNTKQSNTKSCSNNYHPWSSGGDGPIFGIHCNIKDLNELNKNNMDGDDIWQNQLPSSTATIKEDTNEQIDGAMQSKEQQETLQKRKADNGDCNQPHLRAICQYNNDINDCWRCISLLHTISSKLSNTKCSINNSSSNSERYLTCAIEVYDINDGHILLIEAANALPNWVDNDVLQGGVGGPLGCVNRCWLVNGYVHLIPPQLEAENSDGRKRSREDDVDEEINRLSRMGALLILVESAEEDDEENESPTIADEAVQIAIRDRINRTNYSITARPSSPPTLPQEENNKQSTNNNHWHTAAVALPASIARFIQSHPNLVPILIDSFCDNAPEYLKERENGTSSSTNKPFGKSFPYEQIVIQPITITKSNYAELITGRGIVPTFPTPKSYRSVELNRFHRQLCNVSVDSEQFGDIHDKKKGRRNPFEKSVEVGIRLCAGLDWIIANNGIKVTDDTIEQDQYSSLEEDLAINTLGEVERRLRIHWTRIDAEASGIRIEEEINESDESLPSWIEQAWQAGPNGTSDSALIDKSLLQALESMSKCPVFNPELSQPLYKEPCPYTRPNISLLQMVQSGIKNGLKWQRDKFTEGIHFPILRAWGVDTDDWMNVNSLEELEEEMKNLSSSQSTKVDSSDTKKKKPRRTTRRSRKNMTSSNKAEADEKVDEKDVETSDINDKSKHSDAAHPLNKVQAEKLPIKAESKKRSSDEQDQLLSVEELMSQEVNINPSKFLDILHARLKSQRSNPDDTAMGDEREEGPSNAIDEQEDISKFFFNEDLDNNYDSSDSSEDLMGMDDNPHAALDEEDDPFSLHNIMEAMDHELRTDVASHPTIKNLSVASEEDGSGSGGTDADMAVLANLLKSIDEGDGSGPLNTMLNEIGIHPPSQLTTEEED